VIPINDVTPEIQIVLICEICEELKYEKILIGGHESEILILEFLFLWLKKSEG